MNKKVTLPSQECNVVAEVDVLVVGGGAGGIVRHRMEQALRLLICMVHWAACLPTVL